MHLERIKYYTMMCKGNFIITSREDLYNRRLFISSEVKNFEIYLVDESILPKHILILGHSPFNSFGSPYVACPLINESHFNELSKMNGINLNTSSRRLRCSTNPHKEYIDDGGEYRKLG